MIPVSKYSHYFIVVTLKVYTVLAFLTALNVLFLQSRSL